MKGKTVKTPLTASRTSHTDGTQSSLLQLQLSGSQILNIPGQTREQVCKGERGPITLHSGSSISVLVMGFRAGRYPSLQANTVSRWGNKWMLREVRTLAQVAQLGSHQPEPDRGVHLHRGGSRCQAGSGGARSFQEALFRAGWSLVATPKFHSTRQARGGGRWTALALRGPRRL